jgi:DNA-binding response OmpR family regulator
MKILVIDDNVALVRSLKDFLSNDFIVDTARTAEEGLRQVMTGNSDIIILDIGLPDGLGSDVCRKIREAGITTPILILSGVSSIQSRVELLNSGADDYLIKPFSLAELRARIAALTRRMPAEYKATTTLTLGDLTMDLNKRQVKRAGREIELRRKEFDILEYLVRNKGKAVTRTMIFNHAWESDKSRWHNTVDVHIKHLRDKVDRPFGTPLIKTAYGVGYVLNDISKVQT